MEDKPVILIIDDSAVNVALLEAVLHKAGFDTLKAASGPDGRKLARLHSPDLILLDIMMPGESGFDTCSGLKLEPSTTNIPVIFVSTMDEAKDKVKGFSLGAVDFVTKPFDASELIARARVHIRLKQAVEKAGILVLPQQHGRQPVAGRRSLAGADSAANGSSDTARVPFKDAGTDGLVNSPVKQVSVKPGEHYVSKGKVVIRTLLGSCVAACVWDQSAGVVGMNHFLLVDRYNGAGDSLSRAEAGKYGVHAMEMLIDDMVELGARRQNLKAKAFGGAFVLPAGQRDGHFCVGETNSRFVVDFLRENGIPLLAHRLGGSAGRVILFSSEDYSVYVRTVKAARFDQAG